MRSRILPGFEVAASTRFMKPFDHIYFSNSASRNTEVYTGALGGFRARGPMKSIVRLVVLISLTVVAAGQSMKTNKSSATTAGNAKFGQLCEQFVKGSLALSPVSASYAGYHKHKDARTG